MIIKTVELEEGAVYLHSAYGDFDIRELMARLKRFWQASSSLGPSVNTIWDVEDVNFTNLHLKDLEYLAARIKESAGLMRSGRTAVLIKEGFARHAFDFLERLLGLGFLRKFRVFTDKDTALAFVMDENEDLRLDQCA